MRLLHLDFDDLRQPWNGGQARRTWELNRRLAARGWDVTVVTGTYAGARQYAQQLGSGRLIYRRSGVGAFPLNVLSFLALVPLVARRYPHDMLVEDFTTPVGPALAPRWTERPVVGSAQFLFAAEMARKYGLPFDRLERRALAGYRWCVALSRDGAAHVRAAAPCATVAVIPQGLDEADFLPLDAVDGGGSYALYVGRLDVDQKGLDVLLAAWALLPPEHSPPLLVAGNGRDRRQVENTVARLGLTGRVRLLGHVGAATRRQLLREAALVCVPSRYETFGIAAVEALAAGKPLVATDVAGLREAAAEGSLLVPRDDAAALARAVRQLWLDRQLRQELGMAGRQSVEGLTWDAVTDRQEAFYHQVLTPGTRSAPHDG